MTSIPINWWKWFVYCLCMGKYSRCMGCLLTFGTAVVRGLWVAVVCCLAFIISSMAVKVFVNIWEIWQEVSKNFLRVLRWELTAVSEELFRHLPQPQPPVALLGAWVWWAVLVTPSWTRFSLSHLLLPSPRSWDANYCPAQEVRLSLLSWLILLFWLSHPPPPAFLPHFFQTLNTPWGCQVCSQVLGSVLSAWLSHCCERKRCLNLQLFHTLNLTGAFCLFY